MPNPTHAYLGRLPCGCCVGVITDLGDEGTAESVAEFIRGGMYVERVTWDTYRFIAHNELTFMNCPHGGNNA